MEYVTREDQWPRCKHYRWKADQKVMMLTCGHYMHTDCLLHWFIQRPVCPVCVKSIDLEQLGNALNVTLIQSEDFGGIIAYNQNPTALRFILHENFIQYFEGDAGETRHVRTEYTDGDIWYYEGIQDEERLVRIEDTDGDIQYYEGIKGEERLVRVEDTDGDIRYYEGIEGEERLVRVEDSDGDISYYEGIKNEEKLVRVEDSNGVVKK